MNTQFSIGLELTKIFPLREIAGTTFSTVMNYARELRRTGSDLVVEEDLAAIFGRGRLEASLEKKFREEVLKNVGLTPYQGAISLDSRPGPTLKRALKEKDRYYLSAVVQLSLLGWFHKKTDLAVTLTECIRKRFSQKLPDARPDPGFEGILGTLNACNSQTSGFSWNLYVQQVQIKLRPVLEQSVRSGVVTSHDSLNTVQPHALLAFMDYLYLVQSFPDERKIRVSSQRGIIPLIIWSHHILSLTVIVQGTPGGDVRFGVDPSPHVTILWKSDYGGRIGLGQADVCLLDSAMSVVLRVDSSDISLHTISHAERHSMKDYGTTWIRRRFNMRTLLIDDDPIFQEVVQLLAAMAITVSKRLVHVHPQAGSLSSNSAKETSSPCRSIEIDRWNIYETVSVLFSDIFFERKEVESHISKMADSKTLADIPVPSRLETYIKRNGQQPRDSVYQNEGLDLLVLIILTLALVPGVRSCSDMPISLMHSSTLHTNLRRLSILKRLFSTKGPISVEETEFFEVAAMLLAPESFDSRESQQSDLFLISDFGWSLALQNVGDNDPATFGIDRYCFKLGVPTNVETGERKYRMEDLKDLTVGFHEPSLRQIYDRGDSYLSRAVAIVTKRKSIYSTTTNAFLMTLDYQLEDLTRQPDEEMNETDLHLMQHPSVMSGFRALYRSLWRVHMGPSCDHEPDPMHPLPLRLDMVTTSALDWSWEDGDEPEDALPERIAICLTKGDRHMRWLAVQEAVRSPVRQTMLRADGCEECTVDLVTQYPGKWIIIL